MNIALVANIGANALGEQRNERQSGNGRMLPKQKQIDHQNAHTRKHVQGMLPDLTNLRRQERPQFMCGTPDATRVADGRRRSLQSTFDSCLPALGARVSGEIAHRSSHLRIVFAKSDPHNHAPGPSVWHC